MDPRPGRHREFETGKIIIKWLDLQAAAFYPSKSRYDRGLAGLTYDGAAPLAVRLVLLSKTISSTIEAIFLGSQVPEGYTKNKQAAALLTCDTSVVGYPLYQSSMQ